MRVVCAPGDGVWDCAGNVAQQRGDEPLILHALPHAAGAPQAWRMGLGMPWGGVGRAGGELQGVLLPDVSRGQWLQDDQALCKKLVQRRVFSASCGATACTRQRCIATTR